MDVYRAGGITIANAPGTGIADDKAIYSYMPEIVEFYTGENVRKICRLLAEENCIILCRSSHRASFFNAQCRFK